jgi:hypothetical protein
MLDVFGYTCGNCAKVFAASDLAGGYGRLLARSAGQGSMALVHAANDHVFRDVEDGAAEVLDRSQVSDRRFGDVFRCAFSVSCDPDRDGSQFYAGQPPHCPFCGSSRMESRARTGRLVELDVPPVRHSNRSGLEAIKRRSCIREAISDYLSG